jgi:hypothetical protein
MQDARARGVKTFIAMAYAPPVWMSRNGKICPDASVGQSNLPDDEDERAFFPHLPYYKGSDNSDAHGGKHREYIKDFLGDPSFAPLIGNKPSCHAYWADRERGDRLAGCRRLLRAALQRHAPEVRLWQTEYCNLNEDGHGRDLGMGMALMAARVIHHDLVVWLPPTIMKRRKP